MIRGVVTIAALAVALAITGDRSAMAGGDELSPCERECTERHKRCLREAPITGATLLDCINAYYRCAERCPSS